MKTLRTHLGREFGTLDRNLIRSELLTEPGVTNVSFESVSDSVSIEYDPAMVDHFKLLEIMRRYGVLSMQAANRIPTGNRS